MLLDADERRVVRHRRAVVGRGLGYGEREPRVVGLCVVVHVRGCEPIDGQGRHVLERLLLRDALVQLADAQPTREVVGPHGRAEDAGELAGEQAVSREDREQEREHAHEVRCGLAQGLTLGQCLVDEADFLLLEVADAAVHELGRLRRRARREVGLLDQRRPVAHAWRRRAQRRFR